MSILDREIQPHRPSSARMAADRLIQMTKNTYNHMVMTFNEGSQIFWNNMNASPSEIAAELGSDAKEIFELHGKLGALLASVKPESITIGSSVVGDFTMNDDGTVTIVVTTPTPES